MHDGSVSSQAYNWSANYLPLAFCYRRAELHQVGNQVDIMLAPLQFSADTVLVLLSLLLLQLNKTRSDLRVGNYVRVFGVLRYDQQEQSLGFQSYKTRPVTDFNEVRILRGPTCCVCLIAIHERSYTWGCACARTHEYTRTCMHAQAGAHPHTCVCTCTKWHPTDV